MNGGLLFSSLTLAESTFCLLALVFVLRHDADKQFLPLRLFLAVKTSAYLILVPLSLLGGYALERHFAYRLYFLCYWTDFALEATLSLAIIWCLFNLAMAPLGGIKDLGSIVFRWAAATSLTMAIVVVCVPNTGGVAYFTRVITQIQRAQGVLTLSLLLFVCFAIRPLGLSSRSRTFGVVVSSSILAASTLISSGWLAYSREMYTAVDNAKSIATSLSMLICAAYFILPEPKRRMVILPTTSPYLHWNLIAEVLGDAPGFVAIAGVPPEMFAPAELEVMRRASLKMAPTPFTVLDQSQIA